MKHKKILTLVCLLMGLMVFVPSRNVSASTINGTLSTSSDKSHARAGRYADYYMLSGSLGKIAIIEVNPNTTDYIMFMNVGSASVDVSGWTISIYDVDTWPSPKNYTIPSNSVCAVGEVFTLEQDGLEPGVFPKLYYGSNINWTTDPLNTAAVLLRNASGGIEDFFCSGAADPNQITSPVVIPTTQWAGAPVAAPANLSFDWVRTGNSDSNTAAGWTVAAPGFGQVYSGLETPFLQFAFLSGSDASVQMTGLNSYLYLYEKQGSNGSINPSAPQNVSKGGSATFTATPNLGYEVDKWWLNGNKVQTGGTTYTVGNITGDSLVEVTFKAVSLKKVTASSVGPGSISPSGAQLVNKGGSLTFTATPNPGYSIDKWWTNGSPVVDPSDPTGYFTGTNYKLIAITANKTLQVTFKYGGVPIYTVTSSAGSNGRVSLSGPQTVVSGSSIAFTATPNYGYIVDQWLVNGSAVQTGNTHFTYSSITASSSVQVTFKPGQTTYYTVTASGDSNGDISPSGAQSVTNGEDIAFTAVADTGYIVDQWLVNGSVVQMGGTSFTLGNVSADTTVQVTFKFGVVPVYTVSPSVYTSGSNGVITPNTLQTVLSGSSITFTATPATGYVVDLWLVNYAAVPGETGTSFTYGPVTAKTDIQVSFKPGYTVTPSADRNTGSLKLVKSNDDWPGLNGGSLISGLDGTKKYYLEATTWGPGITGSYALSCNRIIALKVSDPFTTSTNAGWTPATTDGSLSSTSAPSHQRSGRFAGYYKLTATKAGSTTIKVTGMNSYIYLYNAGFSMVASNDDSSGLSGGSLIAKNMAVGDVYYLEVTTWGPGVTGSYILSVASSKVVTDPAASGGTVKSIPAPWSY